MMLFRFADPGLLWLLLLLPLFALLRGAEGSRSTVRFPAIGLAKQVSAFVRSRPGRFLAGFRILALVLFIFALARPQWGAGTKQIEASGIDIVLAVDLSGSMWAHDFETDGHLTDRLTVVKNVIEDFIEKRPNDRIGIVAFATDAYLVSPLTLNHSWLLKNLERMKIGIIDPNSTAIGSAITTSVNRLRAQQSESRILVLLTDGANNAGTITPIAAAEAAAAYGIKIHTIGAGREGIVPVPRGIDENGEPLRDRQGRIILTTQKSDIDLETLAEIARITNGRTFHATDAARLAGIYEEIDRLEKTEVKMKFRAVYSDYFMWPVLGGIALLALEEVLRNTRYRRIP